MSDSAEIEVTYHSLALEGPHVSPAEIMNVANMAYAYDPNAYFRAFDGVVYVHWRTESPAKNG